MDRLLLFLVPDKRATRLAVALSAVAFLLGLVDLLSRDFDSASLHLNLSVAILAALFVLKFISMRATYRVAESAQAGLREQFRKLSAAPLPTERSEAEELAREKTRMVELAGELRQALERIDPDSPVRPKYEATLEMMQRMMSRNM